MKNGGEEEGRDNQRSQIACVLMGPDGSSSNRKKETKGFADKFEASKGREME